MVQFDHVRDIPDLSRKAIVVTGGTAGLGKETVLLLAAHKPGKLIFTGRNKNAGGQIVSDVKGKFPGIDITFLECDLASLASVKQAAKSLLATNDRLDILIANAGIAAWPAATTVDGYEVQFGTNHVGHALLIKLLLPLLQKTASGSPKSDVRIISYSSEAAESLTPSGGIVFDKLKSKHDDFWVLGNWRRYGQSKLANALYARALAKRHPEILTVSIHPGVASTAVLNKLSAVEHSVINLMLSSTFKDPLDVALNGIWASVVPRKDGRNDGLVVDQKLGLIENGKYYKPIGELGPETGYLIDDDLADKLWDWTDKELSGWSIE